ncbi:MAG: hypothetical protein ACLQKA_04980 [Bryobacteraceae bacterium]
MMPVFAPREDYPGFIFGPQLEEDVQPVDQVMFTGAGEQKELSVTAKLVKAAEEKPSTTPLKVKVVAPYRVLHEGKPYVGGDTLEVPDDEDHKIWLQSGWVQPVKEK